MPGLSSSEQTVLLALAREAIGRRLGQAHEGPSVPPGLAGRRGGCFVTLKKDGRLRGCIGTFDAEALLADQVREMAVAAAFSDPRFPPVGQKEFPHLRIELSILTPFRPVRSWQEIEVGRHGIYVKYGPYSGTYLPEVAVEQGWDKEDFFRYCALEKAGIPAAHLTDTQIFVYETLKIAGE
ncbi:MAG: AmmeMemoRadiSam system protein A [Candidatus Omnitrophota bacterium]